MAQTADYRKWCDSVRYGKRWAVESAFSAIKRKFGEEVRSRKRQKMMRDLGLKISLYNRFIASRKKQGSALKCRIIQIWSTEHRYAQIYSTLDTLNLKILQNNNYK